MNLMAMLAIHSPTGLEFIYIWFRVLLQIHPAPGHDLQALPHCPKSLLADLAVGQRPFEAAALDQRRPQAAGDGILHPKVMQDIS